MKDKESLLDTQSNGADSVEQELEEIIIQSPPIEQNIANEDTEKQGLELVNISSFINIQGLPDEQVEEQQNLADPMLMKQNEVVDIAQTLGDLKQQELPIPSVSLSTEKMKRWLGKQQILQNRPHFLPLRKLTITI